MKVLRISPDLTIVPSMVQSVAVVPRLRLVSMGTYGPADEPEGYSVTVSYLMAEKPHYVASFDLGPAYAEDASVPGGVRWLKYDERVPSRADCEARAHAVYEEILRAIKDEAA